MASRDYDVILYGATGFTGRQTVAYFARHAPRDVRWAIAGRDRHKLEAVRAETGAGLLAEDVIVADSRNEASVAAMASRTRIVVSTAGPFALYGTPVVDACVRFGTHYVDITGETWWVRDLIARHHERATADGTRIIPCCGFDSVPSDLGAFLIARHMENTLGVHCAEVRAYFQMYGGFNGGTVASLLNMIKTGVRGLRDPFLLDPPGAHTPRQIERSRDVTAIGYDADIGTYTGPFFMAPTNTRVVRRSAALYAQWHEPYGPDFTYQEYLKYDPPFARAKAGAATAGIGLFIGALHQPVFRRVLEPLLPKPGTGPSIRKMDEGWFTCDLMALADDGRRVRGCIRHQGDPGNRATVRFLGESALCLALDGEALPGGPGRGGLLTPATGLGDALVRRLRQADVTIEIGAGDP